jgi:hypothetical protein
MRVPRGTVEKMASNDTTRPRLNCVWLRGDYLEATDAYGFVKVKVERAKSDVDGPIPVLAFELARANADKTIDCSSSNVVTLTSGVSIPRREHDHPPPAYAELVERMAITERPHRVAFNAAFLARIQEAFGAAPGVGPGVVLELSSDPSIAARVLPLAGSNHEALLMPVRMNRPKED